MKKASIKKVDYDEEMSKQITIYLQQLKEKYHSELNVNNPRKKHDAFIRDFIHPEKRRIITELNEHSNFVGTVNELHDLAPKGTSYKDILNKEFEKIDASKKAKTLKGISYLDALLHLEKYWRKQGKLFEPKVSDEKKAVETGLIWKGEETEFMQLIYALHHAGYLDNEENKITKLAPQFAKLIQFKLGKNAESNLSKGIHRTKNPNPPKIFDKLKEAYQKYRQTLINESEENQ